MILPKDLSFTRQFQETLPLYELSFTLRLGFCIKPFMSTIFPKTAWGNAALQFILLSLASHPVQC